MPATCCAYKCGRRDTKEAKSAGISFHKFPFSRPDILDKWIRAVRWQKWRPSKCTVLCSSHFEPECFRTNTNNHCLHEKAVPSIFNFPKHLQRKPSIKRTIRKRPTETLVPLESNPQHKVAPDKGFDRNGELMTQEVTLKESRIDDRVQHPVCSVLLLASQENVDQDHSYGVLSAPELAKQVEELKRKLNAKKLILNSVQRKLRNRDAKIKFLERTLQMFCSRKAMECVADSEKRLCEELQDLLTANQGNGYSESAKKFALDYF